MIDIFGVKVAGGLDDFVGMELWNIKPNQNRTEQKLYNTSHSVLLLFHTKMAPFGHGLIFIFPFLLLINPAYSSNCPKSFECGRLGSLDFPLTNRPGCGLFMVRNCGAENPGMKFESDGEWYNIHTKISENKFSISDPFRQEQLSNHNFCLTLFNLSLPQSPSITFTVSPTLTVFRCRNLPFNNDPIQENYDQTDCSVFGFDAYYTNPETSHIDIPSNCSVAQVPINPNQSFSDNLSSLLTSEFTIEWNVTKQCNECHKGGGECLTSAMNEFLCEDEKGNRTMKMILLTGGVAMAALTFTVAIIFLSVRKNHTQLKLLGIRKSKTGKELDIELFLKDHGNLVPKRYKYSNLRKITKSFSENLGKGGYGSVYKGKLSDGRLVAVKILNESKGNGEEFINEVASISRTSHINIVTLLGFCFEDSKRALVYEFMPNGSLEKYTQNNLSSSSEEEDGLGWEKLFEIALGIARGLDYLHRGCNTRILHFDIKPHNILLDKDFNPKISDFGLAKLCPNRSSIVSMMVARGTIGYIAPEVFCSNFGNVSYKSDVYSYGMVILEIAGEKKRIERADVDRTSETYFPQYIYKQLELMDGKLDDHGIVNEDASQLEKRKLITVGLWCIQTDPKDRPSMSKVVEMLEGKIESLQVPPKPYLSSPPRLALDFSTTSQSSTAL